MEKYHLLRELLILLALSIPVSFIFQKMKFPTLVGFLVTGILIGPGGFQLISDLSSVEILAEIGVVLLLFTIGLEFSFTDIKQIKKFLTLGGFFQVSATIIITSVILFFFTGNMPLSVFIGFLVSLSSTAIVMKSLIDKGDIGSPHGNISMGILLFQDLCVVPMMLLVPFLKEIESVRVIDFTKTIIISAISIIILYFIVRLIFSKIIDQIVKLKNRELFTISIVAICLGTAYISFRLGLSLSIGAFLAGFILSKSEYSHQIVADIMPFRDCFNSIFFISIGMLLNTSDFISNIGFILAGSTGIIVLKFLIVLFIVMLFKYPLRIAVIVGLCLAQIGEFSFVLGKFGNEIGLISQTGYKNFIAVAVISMISAPLLIGISSKTGLLFQKIFKTSLKDDLLENKKYEGLQNHVVIIGYGLNGRNLSNVLKEVGIKHVIIDINASSVAEGKKNGENIFYGDFTKEEVLKKAGIEKAKVAVIAISDPVATRHGLWTIENINPSIYTIVRTRYNAEITELHNLGADQVIPEEFETSIEIFSRVLDQYHIPKNIISAEVSLIRKERYKMLRTVSLQPKNISNIGEILNLTLTETVLIKEGSSLNDKTILDFGLREKTGATIIVVVRKGVAYTNPKSDFKLKENDVLILLGSHAELDKSLDYIESFGKGMDKDLK